MQTIKRLSVACVAALSLSFSPALSAEKYTWPEEGWCSVNELSEDHSESVPGVFFPSGSSYGVHTCYQGNWIIASCKLNGDLYPEGASYGDYTCYQGGWVFNPWHNRNGAFYP